MGAAVHGGDVVIVEDGTTRQEFWFEEVGRNRYGHLIDCQLSPKCAPLNPVFRPAEEVEMLALM